MLSWSVISLVRGQMYFVILTGMVLDIVEIILYNGTIFHESDKFE
jgi:hypothetical protein